MPNDDTHSEVHYYPKRLPVSLARPFVENDLERLLLSKFSAWRYETEYRSFHRLTDSIRDGNLYFEPFSDKLKVAEVIVGDRCDISRKRLADALGPGHAYVTSFKARPAFGSFRVIRNRDDGLWR